MRTRLLAGAAIAAAALIAAVVLLEREEGPACIGTRLEPGADIASAVGGAPEGMRFCLAAGRFEVPVDITPKPGQSLIGAGMTKTFLVGTGARIVIDGKPRNAVGLVVRAMAISGSRGTRACKPSCGSGFRAGPNNLVERVRLHDHPNHGIGGGAPGLLVKHSVLDNNGSPQFGGCCAGGIKGGAGFVIRDSRVHSNFGVGIWCDVGCRGGLRAYDNHVYENRRDGIRYEISDGGAIIRGNVVEDNNIDDLEGGHGGITAVGSANAEIVDNVLGGNSGRGIVVIRGTRGVSLSNIMIAGNELNGDSLEGCTLEGVSCGAG